MQAPLPAEHAAHALPTPLLQQRPPSQSPLAHCTLLLQAVPSLFLA